MELDRKNMKKWMLLITFGLLLFFCLQNLHRLPAILSYINGVFQPIILGFAMAYVFNILMRAVENRTFAPLNRRFTKKWPKARRSVAILATLLLVFGGIALVVFIIVPDLVSTVTGLTGSFPAFIGRFQQESTRLLNRYPLFRRQLENVRIDWSSLSQLALQYGQQFSKNIIGYTITITTNVFNGLVTFTLGFVIAINVLFQKEKLKRYTKRFLFAYLPRNYPRTTLRVLRLTNDAFSEFIEGQCWGAVILGVLCYLGMVIFRFPFALLISVIIALLSLIPILGQIFSVLAGALLILTVSPIKSVWFILFLIVLMQIHGNLIYPKIVGSRMDLPTIWVLIAITLGGNTFGIPGMLVSIPVFAVIRTLLREDIGRRLGKDPEAAGKERL